MAGMEGMSTAPTVYPGCAKDAGGARESWTSGSHRDLRCCRGGLVTLASISTVPEVLTLRKEDRTATLRIPQSALEIASTEFRNPVTLYRIHHFLPRAVSAV